MLYDPSRHEPLQGILWNAEQARSIIASIVAQHETQFDRALFWPRHPKDDERDDPNKIGLPCLYFGAAGVIWALQYLEDHGVVALAQSYLDVLPALRDVTQAWLGPDFAANRGSYLMSETPMLMMAFAADTDNTALADELDALLGSNIDHPSRELMWGSPGSLLAALFLHLHCGQERWAERFRQIAARLSSQLQWSEENACQYWTQDMYDTQSAYLDAVHGFAATASVLIQGRHLLPSDAWSTWQDCIVNTMTRSARHEGDEVNWPSLLFPTDARAERVLTQFCHGAPGFVVCLADLPDARFDQLLLAAGETTWRAGPLAKGPNLCHGTAGNGYAFLKLFARTGDELWLDRARAFAMHSIFQLEAEHRQFSRARYSLWTGDIGVAIFLWDCIRAKGRFPTLDVFF